MHVSDSSAVGAVRVLGYSMLVAGPVMIERGLAAQATVRGELARQRLEFPECAALPSGLKQYAGASVNTGSRAKAYAELIKRHVDVATGGRSYAELAERVQEPGDSDAELVELRDTAFRGETLHAILLGAYQATRLTTLVTGLGVMVTGLGAGLVTIAAALPAQRVSVSG